MGEVINGYTLLAPLSNENAGFAKWGHAKKGGRDYFIKEFLNPCYPTKDSPFDERTKRAVRETCAAFEAEKSLLYSKINEVSDGNLVRVEEFFRWDGKYYITTRWLDMASKRTASLSATGSVNAEEHMSIEDLRYLNQGDAQTRCCLALSHAIMQLHSARIVHADIKPRNVVLTRLSTGNISTKVIDMDSSFFESEPPDELVGDQVYFAPESVMFMIKGRGASPIGCAVDVFAMGLVFHQIFAGTLPDLPGDYNFACEACLDGKKPRVSKDVPRHVRGIVAEMLEADARNRPSMADVHKRLWESLHGRGAGGHTPKAPVVSAPVTGGKREAARADGADSRVRIGPGLANGATAKKAGAGSPKRDAEMNKAFHRPGGL